MTSIPAIDATVDAGPEAWINDVAVRIGEYATLGSRPWDEVRRIQIFPGSTVGADAYVVPDKWLPAGPMRRASGRTVEPKINCGDARQEESLRRSLLALTLPRQTMTGVRQYKPSSWLGYARLVVRMANWITEHRPSDAGKLWGHLSSADLVAVRNGVTDSRLSRRHIEMLLRQLRDLGSRGVISDYPRPRGEMADTDDLGIALLEAPRRGQETAQQSQKEPECRSFQPFPDPFVVEIITRSRWLLDNLAPQLIECWGEIGRIRQRAEAMGRRQSHPSTTAEARAAIDRFDWRDARGRRLTKLPWSVRLKAENRSVVTDKWPPRDTSSITYMIGLIQALNFCVVNFCAGARSSEILSADDDSLDFQDDARFVSRTFKLIDELEGYERDWPLHPVAQRALEVQRQLARVIRPDSHKHLWVLINKGSAPAGHPLSDINESVVNAVGMMDLTRMLEGIRPHSHRWRHTVGRLVALSIVSAPQVLMDLFGHRDLEMTLRYMIADPLIARDVMKVSEEANYALAEAALIDVEEGEAGGCAAPALEKGLDALKMRRGEDELGGDSMREAIEILTFNGRHWRLVRQGVLCTKTVGEFGPCTQGRGAPDPGGCRTDCSHRLETKRAKMDCSRSLAALLDELEAAVAEGMDMVVASLEGQIIANLKRWDDVREHYLQQSEAAKRVWMAYEAAKAAT